ncbi:hypothetical protein [Gymnodinialimonas hymeniacidonis]|uniref:hypothetical protein n=1 Tax=Gymnodinialimonas hymeniacidonis TaxID=3126508 RepID=UPI0034C606D7
MKCLVLSAALFATMAALPAAADQFAVQIDAPYEGASPRLMETLRVTVVEDFMHNDAHYLVIDAPTVGYAEAFVVAIHRDAIELHALDADWTNPAMQHLTPAQRLSFLRVIECDTCVS